MILHVHALLPDPATYVVPVEIGRTGGRYRHRANVLIPPIADGHGALTHFSLKIHKVFRRGGRKVSYLTARCPDGRLQARGRISFADGKSAYGSVFRACRGLRDRN